tara:strand:- start:278 stop:709 length:432 start_codon:yes stop_codon:yes gene_type:complete
VTETSTLTAQEMADKIAELEESVERCSRRNESDCDRIADLEKSLEAEKCNRGHVLALRMTLSELRDLWDLSQILGAETRRRVERADKVLSHTAQVGREAEARAVLRFAEHEKMSWPTTLAKALVGAAKEYANRLRNGGSEDVY